MAPADTDFSEARLVQTANEDLAGGFGNYINRVTTLLQRYRQSVLPDLDEPSHPELPRLCDTARGRLADLDLRGGTQALLDAVATLNRDLEATSPWKLAKDPARSDELDRILLRHHRSATVLVEALAPILPGLAASLRS
ncbi:MAG: methionine--tRNA ligase, partial [Actinomycetota bacterium]|nr:methionine--tRNA ligase [Actinomycetota bacterium]